MVREPSNVCHDVFAELLGIRLGHCSSTLGDGGATHGERGANRTISFMTYNLLHLASMIRKTGGIPAHGNQRSAWDAGCRVDNANPEYR